MGNHTSHKNDKQYPPDILLCMEKFKFKRSQMDMLRHVFDVTDLDQNGFIDLYEFHEMFDETDSPFLGHLFRTMDVNNCRETVLRPFYFEHGYPWVVKVIAPRARPACARAAASAPGPARRAVEGRPLLAPRWPTCLLKPNRQMRPATRYHRGRPRAAAGTRLDSAPGSLRAPHSVP